MGSHIDTGNADQPAALLEPYFRRLAELVDLSSHQVVLSAQVIHDGPRGHDVQTWWVAIGKRGTFCATWQGVEEFVRQEFQVTDFDPIAMGC